MVARAKRLAKRIWRIYNAATPVLVPVLVIVAILGQNHVLSQVTNGRRVSLTISCATTSAVIDAGRATISGSSNSTPPKLLRNLERLGYPHKAQREAQAKAAAKAYADFIVKRVRKAAGPQGASVVNKDGTLNCLRLAAVARAK